jgi:Concanavalin A-like lectin/glucanases superfamily
VTEVLERLEPFGVTRSGLLVPEQYAIIYPGNDAWLEVEPTVTDPGADPAWVHIEKVPDAVGIPNKVVSPTVNTPQTSTATSVFGGSSILMGGTGYALTTPDHADWDLGAGDFTIEGWFRIGVVRKALFAQIATNATDFAWEITMDTGTAGAPVLSFLYATGAGAAFDVEVDRPFSANVGQWYHIAVVRSGANLLFFIDGVQQGAAFNIGAAVIRNSAAPLRIGGDAKTTGNDFNGYMDELRISKGIARYTSGFTVPAAPFTRDQYTVLLMHSDGPNGGTSFVDSSGQAGAPFDPGSDPAWLEIER